MANEKIEFINDVSKYFELFNFSHDVSLWLASLAALESDFGRSRLAKEHKNFVSMKVPFVRISNCTNYASSSDTFASYMLWTDSLLDLVLWIQYQRPMRKQLDDVTLLPSVFRSYCPERDYITKIQSIYQQFKTLQND